MTVPATAPPLPQSPQSASVKPFLKPLSAPPRALLPTTPCDFSLQGRLCHWLPGSYSEVIAAAKSLQSCPTLCNARDGSPPGSCPWDSPGKNTGVGCHFLLQWMKVKSESHVLEIWSFLFSPFLIVWYFYAAAAVSLQSCSTLCDPMDCSLPGSSVHGTSRQEY